MPLLQKLLVYWKDEEESCEKSKLRILSLCNRKLTYLLAALSNSFCTLSPSLCPLSMIECRKTTTRGSKSQKFWLIADREASDSGTAKNLETEEIEEAGQW